MGGGIRPLDGSFALSTRFEYFQARWQNNGLLFRRLGSPADVTNLSVAGQLVSWSGHQKALFEPIPLVTTWDDRDPSAAGKRISIFFTSHFFLASIEEYMREIQSQDREVAPGSPASSRSNEWFFNVSLVMLVLTALCRNRAHKPFLAPSGGLCPIRALRVIRGQIQLTMNRDQEGLRSTLRWLLAGVPAVLYWRVAQNGFLNYDDARFVVLNPHIYTGLSPVNLKWAFTTLNGGVTSYQPLVWLSHELDCQLFGLKAGEQHLTNVWLHAVNAVLLFTLLDKLTAKWWRPCSLTLLFL